MEALRKELEKLAGDSTSHSFFTKLQNIIEERLKEHISVSTMERIWGYSTRKDANISVRILNILAQLIEADNWNDFCKRLQKESCVESELFTNSGAIVCSNTDAGVLVKIGWLPDRVCIIKHLGNCRFTVVNAENASIKAGDEFSCTVIEKGKQLFITNLTRDGRPLHDNGATHYVVGKNNGLTTAEILQDKEQKGSTPYNI